MRWMTIWVTRVDLLAGFVEVEQLHTKFMTINGVLRHVLIHVDGVLEIPPAPPSLFSRRRPGRRTLCPLVSEPVPSTTPWAAGYVDGTSIDRVCRCA